MRIYQRKIGAVFACMICMIAMVCGCQTVWREDVEESAPLLHTSSAGEQENIVEYRAELPNLKLYLNGVTLEEINAGTKNVKYKDNMASLEIGDQIHYFDNVQIKGRGNSTWDWPKKPYQIKFSEKLNLFGMGHAKAWVFLANYRDVSLLRNEEALYLSRELGMQNAFGGQFINLYVDDVYVGLYYMTHKVEIGQSTVDLKDEMGALIEVGMTGETDELAAYSALSNTCLMLKEAVEDGDEDKRLRTLELFVEAFDRLEAAAFNRDWDAVQKEIDVTSFIQYFLISEFSANPDAYVTSCYMYRDGENDVIHAGPIWDFDSAFGNVKYNYGDATSTKRSWVYADPRDLVGIQPKMIMDLYQYLMDIPEFRLAVDTYYQETMRPVLERLPGYIDFVSKEIKQDAIADQDLWHEYSKYWTEVERLQQWNRVRTAYMDLLYGNRIKIEDGLYEIQGNADTFCWRVEMQEDGAYCIMDPGTGNVLGLDDADSIVSGQGVSFAPDNGVYGQRWYVILEDSGQYLFVSKLTGLVLDIGETWTVQEYNELISQQFRMEKTDS